MNFGALTTPASTLDQPCPPMMKPLPRGGSTRKRGFCDNARATDRRVQAMSWFTEKAAINLPPGPPLRRADREAMGWIMDAAFISAISALAGSVIGGLTTGFTTLLTQRSQARAGMIAHDLARREDLVRDFIIAASKTYGDAIGNNDPKMPEIVDLYAMVNRMRVLGMRKTTGCADVVMRSIIDTYFGPKRTLADLRELVRTGQGIDPLKDFSAAAREELRAFALL